MKLPRNAKRVFKGRLYDVYQWPQRMFDGSFETFEKLKRVDTVIIFAESNGKIMVQKQKQPDKPWYLCMPAGRVDKKGETSRQAALRELLEESGYKPKAIKLIKTLNPSHHIDHKVHIFIARGCIKIANPNLDVGEKISTLFYSYNQLLKLALNDNFINGDAKNMIIRANLDFKYQKTLKKALLG